MSIKINDCPRCGKRLKQGDQMCVFCGYIIPIVRKMNAIALGANVKNDGLPIQSVPNTPRYQSEPARETVPYISPPEPGTMPNQPGSTMQRGYSSDGFGSMESRYQVVFWFFIILLVVELAMIPINLISADLMQKSTTISDVANQLAAMGSIEGLIALLYIAVSLGTCISFFFWIHRAYKNLPFLGGTKLKSSPGWAIGWFFVPIAFLWKPYQVVKEIWEVSKPGLAGDSMPWQAREPSLGSIIGWWWALFLISTFLGNIIFRLSFLAKDTGTLIAIAYISVISSIVNALGIIVTILMVKNITEFQEQKSQFTKQ